MTTITQDTRSATPSRTPLLAALGVALAAVLTAVGTFWDATGNESGDEAGFPEYAATLGIIVVIAAIVFGLVVRTASSGNAGRRGVILGVLAVLSVAVFWTGAPAVLAAGAVACALIQRDLSGRMTGTANAASALAAVAVAGAVVLAITG